LAHDAYTKSLKLNTNNRHLKLKLTSLTEMLLPPAQR